MAKPLNETEYMYATARVRSLEMKIPSRDVQLRLLDATNENEISMILREIGVGNPNGNYEEELQKLVDFYYGEIEKIVPEKFIVEIFRYRFDCNNIKSVIKCQNRGLDALDMLFDGGTLDKTTVIDAVSKGEFDKLPKNMADASKKAVEALAKTKNPSIVDLLIDKACYLDMLENCNNENIKGWIRLKIDLTNILIAIRIIRMKLGEVAVSSFDEAFIEGGNIKKNDISVFIEKNEDELLDYLRYKDYYRFIEAIKNEGKDVSLSDIERLADNFYIEKIKESKFVAFGAEIPAGFIEGLEFAVKNIQIILAGKNASLSPDLIRGRLRLNYV